MVIDLEVADLAGRIEHGCVERPAEVLDERPMRTVGAQRIVEVDLDLHPRAVVEGMDPDRVGGIDVTRSSPGGHRRQVGEVAVGDGLHVEHCVERNVGHVVVARQSHDTDELAQHPFVGVAERLVEVDVDRHRVHRHQRADQIGCHLPGPAMQRHPERDGAATIEAGQGDRRGDGEQPERRHRRAERTVRRVRRQQRRRVGEFAAADRAGPRAAGTVGGDRHTFGRRPGEHRRLAPLGGLGGDVVVERTRLTAHSPSAPPSPVVGSDSGVGVAHRIEHERRRPAVGDDVVEIEPPGPRLVAVAQQHRVVAAHSSVDRAERCGRHTTRRDPTRAARSPRSSAVAHRAPVARGSRPGRSTITVRRASDDRTTASTAPTNRSGSTTPEIRWTLPMFASGDSGASRWLVQICRCTLVSGYSPTARGPNGCRPCQRSPVSAHSNRQSSRPRR